MRKTDRQSLLLPFVPHGPRPSLFADEHENTEGPFTIFFSKKFLFNKEPPISVGSSSLAGFGQQGSFAREV